MYGIYEVGKNSVYVFMTETTYLRAYYSDRKDAEEVCSRMNSVEPKKYEVREV